MSDPNRPMDPILDALQERAKELTCLYRVDEILGKDDVPSPDVYRELLGAIPPGWKYPGVARVKLTVDGNTFVPPDFKETPWSLRADIVVDGEKVGELAVYYSERRPDADEGPFLKEERRLIRAIAHRVAMFTTQRRLLRAGRQLEAARTTPAESEGRPWSVVLDFLRRTDQRLLARITNKMINHLCWSGIEEGRELLREIGQEPDAASMVAFDENLPRPRRSLRDLAALADRTFEAASRHLTSDRVIAQIQTWINEERAGFLMSALENPSTTPQEITEALRHFQNAHVAEADLSRATRTSLNASLLRRFLGDSLEFINRAKNFVAVRDFYEIAQHMIYPVRSQGRVGGKGSGIFLASQVLRHSSEYADVLRDVRIPKTWYVASDGVLEFIHYNNLEDLYNRKYMEIERVRQDYPHVIQVCKNSPLPPEIVTGLATALDDFGDRPVIVRSSSLLEDQIGAAFSGKYKSLFLANQGSKPERLAALQDAIAEIYASIFAPDPIEYRAERGLLDFREEMGILIQEVVGQKIGPYFLPAFAGVAFSNNEFRWSPRIKREDGLVRLVPGLGTRAVDRLSDDYPILIAPGQPQLRVSVTRDEIVRYSPQKIDVINLERNAFETIEIKDLLRQHGDDYPLVRDVVSIVDRDSIRRPSGLEPDFEKDDVVVTFEGLIAQTPFVNQIRALVKLLQEKLAMPVDIEFASDGRHLYLLQCRAQSHSGDHGPAPIPRDLPEDRIVFSTHRFVSNGRVPDITHIVYVDPERYAEIEDLQSFKDVGRAVGRLNKLLPKRQFVLMGPGRWGSRGDIKLGVSVSYSEINNTAVLMEIARRKGQYVPELSFGTHFFQDLVEAEIRYLPLYPDEPGSHFNQGFLTRTGNVLPELLPEFAYLADVVRVIDVVKETDGQVLRVLMNAELEEAVGILASPGGYEEPMSVEDHAVTTSKANHWRWRMRMAKRIAALADADRLGIKGLYVFGSTKNATAGPASDIDLLVHVTEDEEKQRALSTWLDGWSHALAEINYLRTGYRSDGLLDVHYVTDGDIERRTSYAVKIGAVTDPARPLPLGSGLSS